MTKGELKGLVREIVEESLREIMLDGGYLLEIIKYINRNNATKIVEQKNPVVNRKKQFIITDDDSDDYYENISSPSARSSQTDRIVQQHIDKFQASQGSMNPELPSGDVPLTVIAGLVKNKHYGADNDNQADEEW